MTPLNSALPRTLDLTLPSNRWAVAGLLAGVALGRARGEGWTGGARLGLLAFGAWALARELDPDHPWSANAALPAALLAAAGTPARGGVAALLDAVPAFALLGSVRVLSASVGLPPARVDEAALGGLAALGALTGGGLGVAAVPGAALALASAQGDRWSAPRPAALPALLALALLPGVSRAPSPGALATLLGALALAATPAVTREEALTSRTDEANRPMSPRRVQLARMLTAGSVALGLLSGRAGVGVPAAAAMALIGVRRLR